MIEQPLRENNMIRFVKKHFSKILAAALSAALVLGVHVPSYAAGSYSVDGVTTYAVGDELYTFLNIGENVDANSLMVDISSDEVERKVNGSVQSFADSGNAVHYVFIVDASGSMKRYISRINAFAEELYDSTEGKSFYTLATFGERFDVIKEKMTDVNTLTHEIENVLYNEQYTDPYTAVISAKTWLDSYEIKAGDVVELILVTDGEPDLKDKDRESKLAMKAQDVIDGSWEFVFNTLCTDAWTEKAEDVFLSDDRGAHSTVKDEDEAKSAADEISDSLAELWYAETALKNKAPDTFSYTFRMIGKDKEGNPIDGLEPISFEGVLKLDAQGGDSGEGSESPVDGTAPLDLPLLPSGNEPSEEPEDEDPAPVEEPVEESAEEPEDDTEDPSGDDDVKPEKDEKGDDEEEGRQTGLVAANTGGSIFDRIIDSGYLPVFIAAAVAVLLIIIAVPVVIIVVVNVKKKKRQAGAAVSPVPVDYSNVVSPVQTAAVQDVQTPVPMAGPEGADDSVPMDIEVQAGLCLNVDRTVYIYKEIRIGRDSGCDIVFSDPSLMPVQARIIRNGDEYIIEDFSNPSNVAIGGMRINGRNPLRSGDVITCGNIQFVLTF